MPPRLPGRRLWLAAGALALPLAGLALPSAEAAAPPPSVQLLSPSTAGHLELYPGGSYSLDVPVYVASHGGPFEVWAQRSYGQPTTLNQVTRDAGWSVVGTQAVDGVPEPDFQRGSTDFFQVTLAKRNGTVLTTRTRAFCPGNGNLQRLNDDGPTTSRYTVPCWASPFTRGLPWGIDQGWAVRFARPRAATSDDRPRHLSSSRSRSPSLPHRLRHRSEDAEVSVLVDAVGRATAPSTRPTEASDAPQAQHRTDGRADCHSPRLRAPRPRSSSGLGHPGDNKRRSGRSFMNFGATAWNAGPGRAGRGRLPRPRQSRWTHSSTSTRRCRRRQASAGTLEYDNRDGHDHWHFRDFAAYSLLDADSAGVVDSGKEAFCLAPTDPIDLTVDRRRVATPGSPTSAPRAARRARCGSARCSKPAGATPTRSTVRGSRSRSPTCPTAPTTSGCWPTRTTSLLEGSSPTTRRFARSGCAGRLESGGSTSRCTGDGHRVQRLRTLLLRA